MRYLQKGFQDQQTRNYTSFREEAKKTTSLHRRNGETGCLLCRYGMQVRSGSQPSHSIRGLKTILDIPGSRL